MRSAHNFVDLVSVRRYTLNMIRLRKIQNNLKERMPKLIGAFKQDKGINAFYLFGSYAKEQIKPLSDIDIAVLLRKDIVSAKYWDYKIKLLSVAIGILKTEEIDLVLLNEAPPELRYNILKEGKFLFCHNEKEKQGFQEKAVSDYLDTEHLRQESYFYLKQQIRTRRFGDDQGKYKEDFESIRRIFGEVGVACRDTQGRVFKK